MQSFRAPRPTTNPYITMLDAALAAEPSLEHLRFDWRRAILGRYDVFHWHWPEGKLEGTTLWKKAGKHVLFALLLLRHRLTAVKVVRTVHNVELPDVGPVSRWLLVRTEALTDHRIVLNATTDLPSGQTSTLILHGHYRDWFARHPREERAGGRLGYFGGIRRYKSIGALLDAYREAATTRDGLSLRIGGRPSSPELRASVEADVARLPDAQATLRFVEDDELVRLVTSSDLVVLAYRFMHNSGSVLAALSLGRPVLVPRNEVNEALAVEVGPTWVQMFDDRLDGTSLLAALDAVDDLPAASTPDLSRREWSDAGRAHAAAYRRAVGRPGADPAATSDGTSEDESVNA
jgi:beta-1,4-mannosyltransferase